MLDRWLGALADPRTELRLEAALHDRQPPGWRIRDLRVPWHLNWLPLTNGIRGHFAGHERRVPAGGWICLPPDAALAFTAIDPTRPLHLLRFRLDCRRASRSVRIGPRGFVLDDARAIRPLVSRLIADADAADPAAAARRRGLLLAAYGEAARSLATGGSRVRGLDAEQVQKLEVLVAQWLPLSPAPAELAAALGLRPDTFARAFRRTLGTSPRSWLAARRIRHAAELLLAPATTAVAVAERCGYADPFHFSKQFARVMGCGPRAWRRRHGLT